VASWHNNNPVISEKYENQLRVVVVVLVVAIVATLLFLATLRYEVFIHW